MAVQSAASWGPLCLIHWGSSRRVAVKLVGTTELTRTSVGNESNRELPRECQVTSVMSNSLCPHGLQPARLLCPWVLQARILEWGALPSSGGSSGLRVWICISYVSCIGRQVLYDWCHLGSPEGCWLGAKSQDQKDPRQSPKSKNRRILSERWRQNWELRDMHGEEAV